MTLWIIYLTSTRPKLSKKLCLFIIPSSLFTMIFFFLNGQNQCVYRSGEHHFVAS